MKSVPIAVVRDARKLGKVLNLEQKLALWEQAEEII